MAKHATPDPWDKLSSHRKATSVITFAQAMIYLSLGFHALGNYAPCFLGTAVHQANSQGMITLVTWVPQNRQGKFHPSLRGCSAPPPFKWGRQLS